MDSSSKTNYSKPNIKMEGSTCCGIVVVLNTMTQQVLKLVNGTLSPAQAEAVSFVFNGSYWMLTSVGKHQNFKLNLGNTITLILNSSFRSL